MIKTSIQIIILLFVKIIHADLTVCTWKKRYGVCMPEEDCFGKAITDALSCGRNICCINPTSSRKRCIEYSKEVYGDFPESTIPGFKIIGGDLASLNEFPHMAAVGFEKKQGKIDWVCGGGLISPNFIISAAHCFSSKVLITWVLLGTVSLDDEDRVLRPVSKITKHPRFKVWSPHYDVALLKLAQSVSFNPSLHPACLLFEHEVQKLKTSFATGWGKVYEDDVEGVRELRKVELDIIPLQTCQKYLPFIEKYIGFLPSMMCAGHMKDEKDTCEGDSGGPLTITMESIPNFHGIVGITSTGSNSCGMGAIYTKVSYFLTWIHNIVWKRNCSQTQVEQPPDENNQYIMLYN